MAIRRVKSKKRAKTRARKRRNPSLAANPRRRRRRNSTKKGAPRKTARRAYKRRNPAKKRRAYKRRNGGMSVAGLPVLEIAIGAGAAIALKQIVGNLKFVTDQQAKDPTSFVAHAIAPALTFAVGWALHKYVKNQSVKNVGKYIALAALVVGVDDVAGAKIKDAVKDIGKPKDGVTAGYFGGAWEPTVTAGALSGAWTGPGLEGGAVEHPSALFGMAGVGGFQ